MEYALTYNAPPAGAGKFPDTEGTSGAAQRTRTQAIADKATRSSFNVLMLAALSIAVYFGSIARTYVSIALVSLLGLLGMVVLFAAEIRLCRT